MNIKIFILSSGGYGARIINNIANRGFSSGIVGLEEIHENTPEFIEDIDEYIPDNLPSCDLILAIGLMGDINLIIPGVAKKTGARSIIVSINHPSQIPPGLQKEIEELVEDRVIVFAKPFCSLKPTGDPYIDEFVRYFGKPEMEIKADGLIKKINVIRGAPCGSTWYIAEELEGIPVEEAEFEAGKKLHNYPCLASMRTDPQVGDTLMHLAGYQIKEAVKKGLGFAQRWAVVDPETCLGGKDCHHLCLEKCPQVKIGEDTIVIREDGKAWIDPASCGCCELCIPECPHGSIEIVQKRTSLK